MNLGIIGLPAAGKKTVFRLLTGLSVDRAPSRDGMALGTAAVRDPRIDRLSAMYKPKKTRYAEFEVVLPPDLQPETARGAAWLEPIRRSDALVFVVRAFAADHVFHIQGTVDPVRDVELIQMEFLLADLALAETRIERLDKERKAKAFEAVREREYAVLQRGLDHLHAERPLRTLEFGDEDRKFIRSLQFLTLKPWVVVLNGGEDLAASEERLRGLAASLREQGAEVVLLSAAIEREIAELAPEEREAFMEDLGLSEPAAHRLSRAAYTSLGLLSFFTVGPDEVRAWPIRRGATAPEAAGRIHSDLERGFIRADTIPYADLVAAGSERAAREASLFRLNGKDYVVQDGDVIEIRFSV
jgi:GTP-binding protein YchF